MKNILTKSIVVLFILSVLFVITAFLWTKPSETVKYNVVISDVNNVNDIVSGLFFETPDESDALYFEKQNTYYFYYENYKLTIIHKLALPFQKEKWEVYCVDKGGEFINTKYITQDTEHRFRAMCIAMDDKQKK